MAKKPSFISHKTSRRKRVLLLHTGGTLGMTEGRPGTLRPGNYIESLLERIPELEQLATIELEIFSNWDSTDLNPSDWKGLAKRISEARGKADGVVIIHGTDTMAYTASALSYALSGIDFPVILTGSQRPLAEVRTDARHNLIGAVEAATLPLCEVGIFFGNNLFRGVCASKVEGRRYGAFESPNMPSLARVGVEELELASHAKRLPRKVPFSLEAEFESRIIALRIIPGFSPSLLLAATKEALGVILITFGAGNLPGRGDLSLLTCLEKLQERNVPVVIVSQVLRGGVDLSRYERGVGASSRGAISAGSMTIEAAITKLMWVLSQTKNQEEVRNLMQCDISGELSI